MNKAIELAIAAEIDGNLPIGAVITLDNKIVAEGCSSIFVPEYNPSLHAEMMAMDKIPAGLWNRAHEMILFTTLEPCVMCFGRILLCGIGKVVFAAHDPEGGAGCLLKHLPDFYNTQNTPVWEGPVMPEKCDALYQRAKIQFHQFYNL